MNKINGAIVLLSIIHTNPLLLSNLTGSTGKLASACLAAPNVPCDILF